MSIPQQSPTLLATVPAEPAHRGPAIAPPTVAPPTAGQATVGQATHRPTCHRRPGPLTLVLMLLATGLWCGLARAETTVGIDGVYRLGSWTEISNDDGVAIAAVETRDGDGMQVDYSWSGEVSDTFAIAGSEAAPLIVKRDDGSVLESNRFPASGSPSRGPALIDTKTPWVFVIGDPLGVETIGANELLGLDSRIAVSRPESPGQLPSSVLGYDGVDLMLVNGAGLPLLKETTDRQRQAIADWLTGGGFLLLTLGDSTSDLIKTLPWLSELLPIGDATVKIDPSKLETYISSQTPLVPFTGVQLPRDQGRIVVMGRTTRRIITPIVVEYIVGFGRVSVVAGDLEGEVFAEWPQRLDLVMAITGGLLTDDPQRRTQTTRATAYDDLAGQLRATLDQFSIDRRFGFSLVSLILLGFIAILGPLDYLLINRVLGRPLLGWLTFPIAAIGLSAVLTLEARPRNRAVAGASWGLASTTTGESLANESGDSTTTSPSIDGIGYNRLEIFDIDATAGVGRGFTAEFLYSHDARSYDVRFDPSPSLDALSERTSMLVAAPFGYPGESYGGIQFAIEDSRLPVYQIVGETQAGGIRNKILGMPIAARSSKGLTTDCRFVPRVDQAVPLNRRQGSELLEGALINPLPFDLLDGILVYRNWAYVLPTRLRANARINSVGELRQRNFRWRLTRQRLQDESTTETEPWNARSIDSPGRVAEMLMFHRLVGGRRYTTLEHQPLSYLDLTHLLASDRCMLIGRIESPLTTIQMQDEQSTFRPGGQSLTFVRYVLPVRNR